MRIELICQRSGSYRSSTARRQRATLRRAVDPKQTVGVTISLAISRHLYDLVNLSLLIQFCELLDLLWGERFMSRLNFTVFLLCIDLLLFGASAVGQTSGQPALDAIVPRVSSTNLARLVQGSGRILVYDVREREEFVISRIPGAMHVNPATPAELGLARIAGRARGATVVFYCAIGMRSADFAQGVYHELMARGAQKVLVLEGGIIDWHNQGQSLVDSNGPSRFVHPFNDELKGRLKNPELARMTQVGYR
jgi:rhodanese-related sulfurtransferase